MARSLHSVICVLYHVAIVDNTKSHTFLSFYFFFFFLIFFSIFHPIEVNNSSMFKSSHLYLTWFFPLGKLCYFYVAVSCKLS